MLVELIKFFVPGSWALLLLGVAAGVSVVFVRPTVWRWAVAFVLMLVVAYVGLSMPWTARTLASRFARYPPVARQSEARGATAVTALAGDHLPGRIQETARLYALLAPQWVIVSGEEELRAAVVAAGVPADRVLWESRARNTREQAIAVRRLAAEHHIDRIVLVASSIHMPRALRACEATGLHVVPSPPAVPHSGLPRDGLAKVRPSGEALWFSSESVYEYLALVYYWGRGWLSNEASSQTAESKARELRREPSLLGEASSHGMGMALEGRQ